MIGVELEEDGREGAGGNGEEEKEKKIKRQALMPYFSDL